MITNKREQKTPTVAPPKKNIRAFVANPNPKGAQSHQEN
jgi:hypothetical protein